MTSPANPTLMVMFPSKLKSVAIRAINRSKSNRAFIVFSLVFLVILMEKFLDRVFSKNMIVVDAVDHFAKQEDSDDDY